MGPILQFIYSALWIMQPLLQLAIVGFLLWRRLHRNLPAFFGFTAFQISSFAILFPLHMISTPQTFNYVSWSLNTISLFLGLVVVYEVFKDVFRPYHTLRDLGTVLFRWAVIVMLLVACIVGVGSTVTEHGALYQGVLTIQRCLRVTQIGLVLFVLMLCKYVGSTIKQRSVGIAIGLGAFAAVQSIAVALSANDLISQMALNVVTVFTYNLTISLWIFCVTRKQPAREPVNSLLTSQRWEDSLAEIRHPQTVDSLIPRFETMVDEAFLRSTDDLLELPKRPVMKVTEPETKGKKEETEIRTEPTSFNMPIANTGTYAANN